MTLNKQAFLYIFLTILLIMWGGLTALVNNDWSDRVYLLSKLISENPDSERLYSLYAIEKGKREGSESGLKVLSEFGKESALQGGHYYYAEGLLRYHNREFNRAIEVFAKVDVLEYKSKASMYTAFSWLNMNNPDKAEQYLVEAVEYNPRNTDALFQLSLIYYKTGRSPEAAEILGKHLELNKYDSKAIFLCSKIFLELGKEFRKQMQVYAAKNSFYGALGLLDRIEAKTSNDINTVLLYAEILKEGEFTHISIPFFNDLLKRLNEFEEHERIEILKTTGFFFQKHILYKRAEEVFVKLNELSGEQNPDHLYWLGGILYARRKFQKADVVLTKSLTIYRKLGITKGELLVLNSLALIDMGVGDFPAAKEKFTDILKKDPGFWQAKAGMADVSIKNDELDEAGAYIKELSRHIPETSFTLVRLKGELGKRKKIRDGITSYRNKKSDG